MTSYRYTASGLIGILLAGIIGACSYPIDTLWVVGVYDGGDYDATALAVASPEALASPPSPPTALPTVSATPHGASIPSGMSSPQLRETLATRAPPSA